MAKVGSSTLLSRLLRSPLSSATRGVTLSRQLYATNAVAAQNNQTHVENGRGKWFTLPPYTPTRNGAVLGKELYVGRKVVAGNETTALKWTLRCCPNLPRSLLQKLFRLRQVRRESVSAAIEASDDGDRAQKGQLKRVAAKDLLSIGDRICLPISVRDLPAKKQGCHCDEEELEFIRKLVLYKDSDIIVINKPPGMPVQGGIGIKRSLDELATTCLTFDYSEPPRLVHRLDRDCSGLLVLARSQTSATVLHSIFREKTSGALAYGSSKDKRTLRRKYWALVIGSPRRAKGLISAPLRKVVVDDGKSDRITIGDNGQVISSQHAITEYQVIESSPHGYTWLELSPLTGRKHQLRVHCAEVLGTPIVGDYKYGWQTHKEWKPLPSIHIPDEKTPKALPFGLDLEGGSITSKHPYLHLHSKEMCLPNISEALKKVEISSEYNASEVKSLRLVAPLPTHMQISWDVLNSRAVI